MAGKQGAANRRSHWVKDETGAPVISAMDENGLETNNKGTIRESTVGGHPDGVR